MGDTADAQNRKWEVEEAKLKLNEVRDRAMHYAIEVCTRGHIAPLQIEETAERIFQWLATVP